MSSWQISWSGRQEPAEANTGAPGTAFGCDVVDGGSPVNLASEGAPRIRGGWLRMTIIA